jgi:Zn-dependent peptidase ImmA (M78 family)
LTFFEALRIAELQAQRLLALGSIKQPAIPITLISEIPRIKLTQVGSFPTSGASHWFSGQWLIIVNGSEHETRRRFTTAHEFKHILDDRFAKLIYSQFPHAARANMIERLCDYFAGCLLVPRTMLKFAYGSGIQDPTALANKFRVSTAAIKVRLRQTGLVDDATRCDRPIQIYSGSPARSHRRRITVDDEPQILQPEAA